MLERDRTLPMYLHLARASHARRQALVRDKLLVLAGATAQEMGLEPISANCRQKILANNAQHLIRQWPTFMAALADEHFQSYLKQLKRRYSSEKIEHMLESLGIELGREREAYFTDLEYANALLDAIPAQFADVNHKKAGMSAARAGGNGATGRQANRSHRPWTFRAAIVVWGPFLVGLIALVLLFIAS